MATRGTALLTSILVAGLLSAGGCIRADGPSRPESASRESAGVPSPTANPVREEFLEALQRTQRASYKYTVRGSLPEGASVQATGAFDPKARLFEATIKTSGGKSPSATHRVVVGKHSYLRSLDTNYWVHLDLSRVKKESLVYFDMSDPTGLVQFGSVIGSVKQAGPRAYEGRFNPENAFEPFVPIGAPSVVAIGMLTADFTAKIDDRGWVTSITVEMEPRDGPAISMTTVLSGHGTKLAIKAPPKARVKEAADTYYEK